MSSAHAVQAVQPPAHATAAPIQRKGTASEEALDRPQRLLSSLASVPAVQRKCADCDATDEHRQMPVQPALEVGPVDDPYEREADQIAGQVMAMREPVRRQPEESPEDRIQPRRAAASIQRTPAPLLEADPLRDPTDMPRMKPDQAAAGPEHIAASAAELTSGGSPLSAKTREFFESRMGRDLSDVRIHRGVDGQALNASISARAFTYRNHIWLSRAEPSGPSFTMAHELAHVLQQTAPGPVGTQQTERETAASASSLAVQRRKKAFWLPGKTLSAGKLHQSMHDRALEEIGKAHPSILSEVPIPGATRKLVDVGAEGRADIYTATPNPNVMVPGLKEELSPTTSRQPAGNANPAPSMASLADFKPKFFESMKQGSTKIDHEGRRAPKIDSGTLTDIASAPANIQIGEMKPAHDMGYRESGAKQIANYMAGITSVAKTVNSVSGLSQRWKPDTQVIDGTSLIPSGWDVSKTHTDWPITNLKIRHYKPTRAKTPSGKRKVKAVNAHQGRKKSQPIRGRWMMAPDNAPGHKGVFVYFLAPNPSDLDTALKPASTRKEFRELAAKLQKIKQDLITSPKSAASGAKPKPRRLPAKARRINASPAAARVVRKELKDDFKATEWEQARTGAGLPQGKKDNSLLGEYATAADSDLREDIAEKGAMVEWLKNKPETKGTEYTEKTDYDSLLTDLKLLKGVDFWTGIKAKPFGILREKFGLFFVKAYDKAVGLDKKIREKFKSFNKDKILAGGKGTIIKAAAKVASVVLPRLAKPFLAKMFDTIIECGIKGFEAKFRELVEGTVIDDVIETADQLKDKVEKLATDMETFFQDLVTKTMTPITREFEQYVSEAKLAMDVVKMIKEITQAIRIGSCVAGLALAPETVGIGAVVGCGAALGDYILSKFGLSPVDHLIGTILSSCKMQNKLGALMAGIGFIKTLPGRAGKAIIKEVKSRLKNSKELKDLGAVKGKDFGLHASELFCNPDGLQFPDMGYEKSDCSDTGSYRTSKTGSFDIPDNIPLYEKEKPIPASERLWRGREIPPGREGELAPDPTKSKPPKPSKQGNDNDAETGGVSNRPDSATEAPRDTSAKPIDANLEIRGDFNDKTQYDGTQRTWGYLSGTDSNGAHYDDIPVAIRVFDVYNKGNQPHIKFKFRLESKKHDIILHDSKTGSALQIWDSGTKIFDLPIRP